MNISVNNTARRVICLILALITLAAFLPAFEIRADAASKKIDFYGNKISADAEKLCFYFGSSKNAGFYVSLYTNEYDKFYVIEQSGRFDCAEIAENFPKLKRLALIAGDLKNIEALSKLKNLATLEIYCCDSAYKDISFIKNFPDLKRFIYRNTECYDVSAVKYLKKLTVLKLEVSARDFSAVKGLTKLKDLYLYGAMKNTEYLAKLKNLTSLKLDSWILSDITEIGALDKLKSLTVYSRYNNLDTSPIEKLTGLEELVLNQGMGSLDFLTKLKNLKTLQLSNLRDNKFITVSDLKNIVKKLPGLEKLSLSFCGDLKDLNFISGMKKLKKLRIFGCPVSDISGLKKLTGLEELGICYINGSRSDKLDISPLKALTGLKELDLSYTPLKDNSVLKYLKELNYLDISGEHGDLSAIKRLDKLKTLYVFNCGDINTLEEFKKAHPECEITPDYSEIYDEYY